MFFTTSDDGVRLFVNNVQVINNWTDHSATENSGTLALTAGQLYDVRMEFYENGGQAVARLSWSAPGVAREAIPPRANLYPYALFVVGSTTLSAADAAARDRLVAEASCPCCARAARRPPPTRAARPSWSSSTSNSGDVTSKFRAAVTPAIVWEPLLFDDFGMTGTASTSMGTQTGQTQVAIVNAAHPSAAGLSAAATVSSATTFTWGVPNANAVVGGAAAVETRHGRRSSPTSAEQEWSGSPRPAAGVGLFLHDTTARFLLTAPGRSLVDAALRWATGQ